MYENTNRNAKKKNSIKISTQSAITNFFRFDSSERETLARQFSWLIRLSIGNDWLPMCDFEWCTPILDQVTCSYNRIPTTLDRPEGIVCGRVRVQRHCETVVSDTECGDALTVSMCEVSLWLLFRLYEGWKRRQWQRERAIVAAIAWCAFLANCNIVQMQNFRGKTELCIKNGMQRSHAIRIIPCVEVWFHRVIFGLNDCVALVLSPLPLSMRVCVCFVLFKLSPLL